MGIGRWRGGEGEFEIESQAENRECDCPEGNGSVALWFLETFPLRRQRASEVRRSHGRVTGKA